jgi:hypothetical protein
VNDNNLYAIFLDWPGEKALIQTIRATGPDADKSDIPEWAKLEDASSLAGTTWDLPDDDNDTIVYHYEFTSENEFKVSGGEAGEGLDGVYEQVGNDVYLRIGGFSWSGQYDGKEFSTEDQGQNYPGFYKE